MIGKKIIEILVIVFLFGMALFWNFNEYISSAFFNLLVYSFPSKFSDTSKLIEHQKEFVKILYVIETLILNQVFNNIKWFKREFKLTIKQKNLRYEDDDTTNFNDRKLQEPQRTVKISFSLSNKSNGISKFILFLLKNKEIELKIFTNNIDSDYIALASEHLEEKEEEVNVLIKDIKEDIIQILGEKEENTNEKLEYIIGNVLEDCENKEKDIFIKGQLIINGKDFKEYFILKKLLKITIENHKVRFNIAKVNQGGACG